MSELSRDLFEKPESHGRVRTKAADFLKRLINAERNTVLWRKEEIKEENIDDVDKSLDPPFLRHQVDTSTDTVSSIYFKH